MEYEKMLVHPEKKFTKAQLISGIKRKKKRRLLQKQVLSLSLIIVGFTALMMHIAPMNYDSSVVVESMNLDSIGVDESNYYLTALESEDVFWDSFDGIEELTIKDIKKEI